MYMTDAHTHAHTCQAGCTSWAAALSLLHTETPGTDPVAIAASLYLIDAMLHGTHAVKG